MLPTSRTFFRCRIVITYAVRQGAFWGAESCYGAQFKQMPPRDQHLLEDSLEDERIRFSSRSAEPFAAEA